MNKVIRVYDLDNDSYCEYLGCGSEDALINTHLIDNNLSLQLHDIPTREKLKARIRTGKHSLMLYGYSTARLKDE